VNRRIFFPAWGGFHAKKWLIALLSIFATVSADSSGNSEKRSRPGFRSPAWVMKEILNIPDDIPKDLLDRAECVIVLPSVKKLAIGIGGKQLWGAA